MSSLREDGPESREKPGSRGRERLWMQLEGLLERVERGGAKVLTDKQLGEMGRLYRAATTHLAQARSFGASSRRRDYLNALVTRGHAALYGRSQAGSARQVLIWSPLVFPQVVRKTWPFHLTAFLLILLAGIYGYRGAMADPEWALEVMPGGETRTPFASRSELEDTLLWGRPGQGATEMSGGAKAAFASFLWSHNTRVGLLAFFSGALAGVPTIVLDLFNGLVLGVYTATFHRHGLAYQWWAWILPHGVTEFLAIILLSGGGLLIGYQVIAPGSLSRVEALRRVREQALHIIIFGFPMFFVAAGFESWVRQSGMSDEGRYVFAAVTAIFWTCYLLWGRVPEGVLKRREADATLAEKPVPTPTEQELLGGLGLLRGGRPAGAP